MLPPENLDAEPTEFEKSFADYGERDSLLSFDELPIEIQRKIQEKRKQQMITLQRNNLPQGASQTPKGIQFLKPMHATKQGVKATIYKVTTDKPDNFGNPYVVYFSIGGQKYSKGFKPTSDNLAALVDILGADESKWKSKSVTVFRVVDEENSERLAFGN